MRAMAIDYGDARTGIAVSDLTGLLAGHVETIQGRQPELVAERVGALAKEYGVTELVLGFPKNMNATLGARAEKTQAFAAMLEERTGLPVILWDERRTTVDADRILMQQGVRGRKKKAKVDAVAATLILEGYLLFQRGKRSEGI